MSTRNITLSLPEDLVRRARILAAERDTSVSSLVMELLEQELAITDDYDELWAQEMELMASGSALKVGTIKWSRDDLHDR